MNTLSFFCDKTTKESMAGYRHGMGLNALFRSVLFHVSNVPFISLFPVLPVTDGFPFIRAKHSWQRIYGYGCGLQHFCETWGLRTG